VYVDKAPHGRRQHAWLYDIHSAVVCFLIKLLILQAMYKRLWETQRRAIEPRVSEAPSQSGQDPEATLQFLKSAVYYFLTDRDNHLQHLRAIENILGFSQQERLDIQANLLH